MRDVFWHVYVTSRMMQHEVVGLLSLKYQVKIQFTLYEIDESQQLLIPKLRVNLSCPKMCWLPIIIPCKPT